MSTSLERFWESNIKVRQDQLDELNRQHSEIAEEYGKILSRSDVHGLREDFLAVYFDEINQLYGKADIRVKLGSAVPIEFSFHPAEDDVFNSLIASYHNKIKDINLPEAVGDLDGGRVAISLPSGVDDYVWTPNDMSSEQIEELKNYCVFDDDDIECFFKDNVDVPVQFDLVYYTHGRNPTVISFGDISNIPVIFNRVPGYSHLTPRQEVYRGL